ncbi:MAG: pyridoxamine 5'-phosphate oxidase family protein [Patescibacteria group bacterium]|nr:pyridoxamine 5'-phosphate oxidase family protein [Patescibacteria group bacterium]
MFKKSAHALTERQQIMYDFINTNRIGVLASVDPNGEPHAAVIYHTVDTDFNVSFLTKTGTKKYDNLIRHNHTVYVIYEPKSQTVAQITGEAVEILDGYEINQVAAAVFITSLRTSDGGVPPIAKLQAGDYTAFRIKPRQIRMASYARPDAGDYSKIFESIESFELHPTAV